MMTQSDKYVLVVDELKNGVPQYLSVQTNTGRKEYIKALSKWFKAQCDLLKQGKPNELRLTIKQVEAPATFIDTYHQ